MKTTPSLSAPTHQLSFWNLEKLLLKVSSSVGVLKAASDTVGRVCFINSGTFVTLGRAEIQGSPANYSEAQLHLLPL